MSKLLKLIPWFIFICALFFAFYIIFSKWAVKADSFGKTDMGLALFFSFSGAYALYISLGLTFISFILIFVYKFLNIGEYKGFVYTCLVGFVPIGVNLYHDLINGKLTL